MFYYYLHDLGNLRVYATHLNTIMRLDIYAQRVSGVQDTRISVCLREAKKGASMKYSAIFPGGSNVQVPHAVR